MSSEAEIDGMFESSVVQTAMVKLNKMNVEIMMMVPLTAILVQQIMTDSTAMAINLTTQRVKTVSLNKKKKKNNRKMKKKNKVKK